ncbi:ion channel [Planococcus lenghuensis]|uniref:Potassium channel domain-containing protein n=1 Tax=Planococcus lenghuensis TaxID=2213202 RepID=A0A1Q2L4F5_9BACL|nr:ion channel [Planococcus lenghuensis]AQQ55303.1 hypothetical protein B0X71_19190 [Planococcus lenghuensis]
MYVLYFIIGLLILIATILDFLWTTLWVNGGAGPISKRVVQGTWKGLNAIGSSRPTILGISGPLSLTLTLLMWILLLWIGWTFIFAGGETVLTDTRNNAPISWVERAYYAGYLIFTLGNGDFSPHGGFWQIMTAIATANGMLFLTLGATYVLSVLNAVTLQRAFADSITGMGMTSDALVQKAWNGKDLHEIDFFLNTTSSMLGQLTAQHKAYPVLHFYHTESKEKAAPFAIAVLDDALTILEDGVEEQVRPNRFLVEEAQSSVKSYLSTVVPSVVKPASTVPPSPAFEKLRTKGIPVVSDEMFADVMQAKTEHRKKLLGVVESDKREWPI